MIPPNLLQLQKAPGFTVPAPAAPQVAPRPQGFLGGLRQFLTPERLRVIGAGLADLSNNGNSLPALLQQLDEQRAQLEQQRWQRIQEDHAMQGWKREAQQQGAVDDMISSGDLTPTQQSLARAAPNAFLQNRVRQAFPDPPQWQAGYDRAYRINPTDGSTQLGGPIPHAPRAAGTTFSFGSGAGGVGGADGAGDGASTQEMGMDALARQFAHGVPMNRIAGMPRNSAPAIQGRAVQMLMDENPGMTRVQAENRLVENRSNFSATDATVRNMTLGNEQVQRAFQELEAFNQISQEQMALLRNGDNTVINRLRNQAAQIFGDPNITGANNALSTQLRMFARIASGGTGSAAQTHVAALEQAADILDTSASPAMMARAFEIMAREAPIVRDAYQHRLEVLQHRLATGNYSYNGEEPTPASGTTLGSVIRRTNSQILDGPPPAGIPQTEWDHMSAADRARVRQITGGR